MRGVTVVAILASLAVQARAQTGGDPDPSHEPSSTPPPMPGNPWRSKAPAEGRSGLLISFALGYGFVAGVEGTEDTTAFRARAGWALDTRTTLALDLWAVVPPQRFTSSEESYDVGGIGLAAVRWVTPRLWLLGGVGFTGLTRKREGETSEDTGYGFSVGVGYELVHCPTYAVDLQLSGASAFHDHATVSYLALVLGMSFFGVQ